MSDQSPRLRLPFIAPSQAQKHVTHNEALNQLDILVQLTLCALDVVDPPSDPSPGIAFALGSNAQGEWAGHDGQIAAWVGGGWLYLDPQEGFVASVSTQPGLYLYRDGKWDAMMHSLDGLGIGTRFDPHNRLAVRAPATLFTHAGQDHRLAINKADADSTASIIFQSNWNGLAEIGLTGTDDFVVKVRGSDGSFPIAMRVDSQSGRVDFPHTKQAHKTRFEWRYCANGSGEWTCPVAGVGESDAQCNLGVEPNPRLEPDLTGLIFTAGSVIEKLDLFVHSNHLEWQDFDMRVFFQSGPWNNGWNNAETTSRAYLYSVDRVGLLSGEGYHKISIDLEAYQTVEDGYFCIAIRPIGAFSEVRDLHISGIVHALL